MERLKRGGAIQMGQASGAGTKGWIWRFERLTS